MESHQEIHEESRDLAPADRGVASIVERVTVLGDLSKLTPDERVAYYAKTCESLGLNPLTRPFEYINLSGKLTLYARRDATDQLRSLRRVSVRVVSRERVGDVYCVTARATDPAGRSDEAIGAVSVAGLRGDSLANAIMKAETKAKRRVTLSIVGLGWLDESEIETIPTSVVGHVAAAGVGLPDEAGSLWKRVDAVALAEIADSLPEAEEDARAIARSCLKELLACWPEEDRAEVLKAATVHHDKKSGRERWVESIAKLDETIDRGQYAGQPAVRDDSCLFAVERIIRRARERGLLGDTVEHVAA